MLPPNPYLNRLPIQRPEAFFGREQALHWLLERILHEHPQCCAITGVRRLGKSSLLRFLAHPEGARRRFAPLFDRAGHRLLLVYSDLSLSSPGIIGGGDEANDEATATMLGHLLRSLDRETRSHLPKALTEQIGSLRQRSDNTWQGQRDALIEALERLQDDGYRVVFLLDSLDIIEALPIRLAYVLRALVMEHNVGYVTASLAPLHDLLQEGQSSPLYNLFSTFSLPLMEPDEARALLVEPARALGVTWSDELTEQVLDAVGGHPDLIMRAASHLWDSLQAQGAEPRAESVLAALRVDSDKLFTSLWDHLSAEDRELVSDLARVPSFHGNPHRLESLKQRALITTEAGEPRLFASLFTEWVQQRATASSPAADNVRLDGRWLILEGNKLLLTPIEARLVEVLLQRRGHTVGRADLQQAIWDRVDEESKALDTTVQRLREKIEADRTHPRWLVTVRGEGYSFK